MCAEPRRSAVSPRRRDLHHRQVGVFVGADGRAVARAAVRQHDSQRAGTACAADDVRVGQDQTFAGEDEARTRACAALAAFGVAARDVDLDDGRRHELDGADDGVRIGVVQAVSSSIVDMSSS